MSKTLLLRWQKKEGSDDLEISKTRSDKIRKIIRDWKVDVGKRKEKSMELLMDEQEEARSEKISRNKLQRADNCEGAIFLWDQ